MTAKTAEIKRFWNQPVTIKGKIWETHIRESRIRPNEKVKVGLNKLLIKSAVEANATLKVHVWDKDVWFQVPAWKWHAYSWSRSDFDYQPARFRSWMTKTIDGEPYLPIYLFPIPERAYKRKGQGANSTDKALNREEKADRLVTAEQGRKVEKTQQLYAL